MSEEKKSMNFSEKVAEIMMPSYSEYLRIQEFFRELKSDSHISMLLFSTAVLRLIKNSHCTVEDKKMLSNVIVVNMRAMNHVSLRQYLSLTCDEHVAEECVKQFFKQKQDFREIRFNSLIAWNVRRTFAVLTELAPSQRGVFATKVLKMFPNLSGGNTGTGGLRALIIMYARVFRESQTSSVGLVHTIVGGTPTLAVRILQDPRAVSLGERKVPGQPQRLGLTDKKFVNPIKNIAPPSDVFGKKLEHALRTSGFPDGKLNPTIQ